MPFKYFNVLHAEHIDSIKSLDFFVSFMGLKRVNDKIRAINSTNNSALARVIRQSLEEFGAVKPGPVYFDPTTDNLSSVFEKIVSFYLFQ